MFRLESVVVEAVLWPRFDVDSSKTELSGLPRACSDIRQSFVVITSTEVLLEPNIKANEKVTATHLSEVELGDASPAVPPSNWCSSPLVSPYYRFEGKRRLEAVLTGRLR